MSRAPVSVIVPCYHCAHTIERAAVSITQQTMQPEEILLVDDGNDAENRNAIESVANMLEQKHCRTRIVRLTRNSGPATARNAGWDLATQPYIAFLDADDSWHPQKIELQYNWMNAHPSIALSGHAFNVVSNLTFRFPFVNHLNAKPVSVTRLLMSNRLSTPTVMCRRDIPFRFISGKRFSEDYLLWLSLGLRGYPLYYFDNSLTYLFKAPFGKSGLSSHLCKMELGELDTYRHIYDERLIGYFSWMIVSSLSIAKFGRRLIVRSFSRKKNC